MNSRATSTESKSGERAASGRSSAAPTVDASSTTVGALDNQTALRVARSSGTSAAAPPPPLVGGNWLAQSIGRAPRKTARRTESNVVQAKCVECEELARQGGVRAKCDACSNVAKGKSDGQRPLIDVARPALTGASAALPHFDRIQAAFGRHDLSQVRTKTGADAAEANARIGARAFTSGDRIAFQRPPDAWLAAHEAAHVVQQRDGRSAPDEHGASRDVFEQHADRVADAVVGGRSAERILDEVAGSAHRTPSLQLKNGDEKPDPDDKREPGKVWRFQYEGVWFSDDPAEMRQNLEDWGAKQEHPHKALQKLVADVATQKGVAPTKPAMTFDEADQLGVCPTDTVDTRKKKPSHEADPDKRIALTANSAVQLIIDTDIEWLQKFKATAIEIANGILDESKQRVVAEMDHYGIRDARTERPHWYSLTRVTGEMDDNGSTRSLGIVAQGLVNRKKALDDAYAKRKKVLEEINKGDAGWTPKLGAALSAGDDEVIAARRDLQVFRIQAQQMFPILASYAGEGEEIGDIDKLQTLAALQKGKDPEATSVLTSEIGEKLVNINKVRAGLAPGGDVNIWRVPKIIDGTRAQMKAPPASLHGKILDEKIEEEQPSALTGILIGLLQVALVVAAPFTEGATLIPAAMLSVGSAYEEFKKYELESQLHGTDFGAAALSAQEPSLFWLGVAVAGAALDVGAAGGAAFKLFRSIAPAAKAIKAGEAAEQAARELEVLRQAARDAGATAEEVERITNAAKQIQASGGKLGITVEEAEAIEKAGQKAAEQQLATHAGEEATLAGGKAKVSKAGDLWSCHSPCMMMRERYDQLIKRNPAYAARIDELESRARLLAEADDAGRQALAKEAAALEIEMRKTVLPGDWKSPLSGLDSAKYEADLAKRGSALPHLDHHPPGWTGWDEARFLYGEGAVDELAKRGKYTFVLQENGELAVRRLDATLPPLRFNPASGSFEVVEVGEVVKAEIKQGTGEAKALSELTPEARAKMDATLGARTKAIARRNDLELLEDAGKLSEDEAKELSKLRGQINDESRKIGEAAADDVMQAKVRKEGGGRLYPPDINKPSTAGDFDRVYKVGDEYYVVEAKGGSSTLGTRTAEGGVRAQQGTTEYFKSIVENMKGNPQTLQLATDLEKAFKAGKLKYIVVRAPIGTQGGAAVLGDVKMGEFLLK